MVMGLVKHIRKVGGAVGDNRVTMVTDRNLITMLYFYRLGVHV